MMGKKVDEGRQGFETNQQASTPERALVDEGRLLTDKQLRTLAHEYFKIGTNKNSLQAGHWIGLAKHLLIAQQKLTVAEKDDEWTEKLDNHSARLTQVLERDMRAECQQRVEKAVAFIESYFVTTIEPDGIKLHHIDGPEWESVKERLLRIN